MRSFVMLVGAGIAAFHPIGAVSAEPDRASIVKVLTSEGCGLDRSSYEMVLSGAAYDKMFQDDELMVLEHTIFLTIGECKTKVGRIFGSTYGDINAVFEINQCVLSEEDAEYFFANASESVREKLIQLGTAGVITTKVDGPGQHRLLAGNCRYRLPAAVQDDIASLIKAFKSRSCKITNAELGDVMQAHGLTGEMAERAIIAGRLPVQSDSEATILADTRICQ